MPKHGSFQSRLKYFYGLWPVDCVFRCSVIVAVHEKFNTTSLQSYAEYQWMITPRLSIIAGTKYAYYKSDLDQFADNGKTVGNLNGAPSVQHTASYSAWQPSFDTNYKLKNNWSVYAQFA